MKKYYTVDERLNVSRGLVLGTELVHRCGYNADVDTTTDPETVWTYGGLYPWSLLADAEVLTLASSNTADTMAVTVIGLDNDFLPLQATVTLTGTTPVTTGEVAFRRINDFIVNDGAENVGEIIAYTESTNTNVVAHIPIGEGQSQEAFYTVPAGKTGYLYCGDASLNDKSGTIKFYVRELGSPFRIAHIAEIVGNTYRYDFPFPIPLAPGSDLEVRLDNASDNNIRISANFDILLVDNIPQ